MKDSELTPEMYALRQATYAKYRTGPKYAAVQERFKATKKRNITAAAGRRRVRAEQPEKYRAWLAVASAVRSGRITKPTACMVCGGTYRLDAHHYAGYEPPNDLRVSWLCRHCHKAVHGKGVVTW